MTLTCKTYRIDGNASNVFHYTMNTIIYIYIYIYVVYLIYLGPLHVSAVQISHHDVGHGYTRAVERRGCSLNTSTKIYKVIILIIVIRSAE
jgi:hypothetical protein